MRSDLTAALLLLTGAAGGAFAQTSEDPTTEADLSTTTGPTTTPDCGHLLDCSNLTSGWYPDPYNCRKYWHCINGSGEHLICRDDLVFNDVDILCDYPNRVDCGDRPVCDECDNNCVEPTTASPTVPDCGHQLDCSNMTAGWYADEFNCRKYWHCADGVGEHFTCKDDMLYDPVHVWCDTPDRVECGERPICDDCDEGCEYQPTLPPDCDHPLDCTDMRDGWYPDPYNCRKFWHCEHGSGQHFTCDGTLLYDPQNVWCDFPNRVKCGDRPICDDCDDNCHPQLF
jgi:hypothetical protein